MAGRPFDTGGIRRGMLERARSDPCRGAGGSFGDRGSMEGHGGALHTWGGQHLELV
jgi:hypothetical protein